MVIGAFGVEICVGRHVDANRQSSISRSLSRWPRHGHAYGLDFVQYCIHRCCGNLCHCVARALPVFGMADTDIEDEPAIAMYTKLESREDVLHFDIPVEGADGAS